TVFSGESVQNSPMSTDAMGFSRLLGDLSTVHTPEIIIEATGVYSRRLHALLDEHGSDYTRLNSIDTKKPLDVLSVRIT
ncbi:IS110 family transposase, partial [Streptococcus suis]